MMNTHEDSEKYIDNIMSAHVIKVCDTVLREIASKLIRPRIGFEWLHEW